MKRILVFLLLLGCLTACHKAPAVTPTPAPTPSEAVAPTAAPEPTEEVKELWGFPIDNTHDAFEVDTNGKLGTVLVTVEQGEELTESEFGGYHYTLSVWSNSDLTTPIQTFEEAVPLSWDDNSATVTDANFDGYTDFLYKWGTPSQNWPFSLYVWNEEQGQFVFETSFVGRWVSVDEETQTIRCAVHYTNYSGAEETYRWEDGELVCFRKEVYDDITLHGDFEGEEGTEYVTYELVDGEWQEVFRKIY